MTTYTSPVPFPSTDAQDPGPYREIYGMPMFVTVPTGDLRASADFWTRGLGFIELFAIPGRLLHLRRWAFQDVLLVPGTPDKEAAALSVSFACVLGQLADTAARCEALAPGCTGGGPEEKPWNSVELTVVTPENARVVMTAAKPLDPAGPQADYLRAAGFDIPDA